MMTLKFSRNAIVTCSLTDRRPVRPAADDDFACLRPATLLKKNTLVQVFPCEFGKIFRNTFFAEQSIIVIIIFLSSRANFTLYLNDHHYSKRSLQLYVSINH